jgi:hypothetical protein
MEAQSLIETLGWAARRAFDYEAPFWLQMAGCDFFIKEKAELKKHLENNDTFLVRLALKYPPRLPENDH